MYSKLNDTGKCKFCGAVSKRIACKKCYEKICMIEQIKISAKKFEGRVIRITTGGTNGNY